VTHRPTRLIPEDTAGSSSPPAGHRLGVDTGGTFTDFVWLTADGRWQIHKQLSTPSNPAQAIVAGIEALAVPVSAAVIHGSTVATNALLERRGARTALVTTKGFADVLAIGRQNRPDLYALVPQKPPPLVPADLRLEVDERVTADGQILRSLNPAELERLVQQLLDAQVESVAVCLLFSFLRPEHERQIGAALHAAGPHISLSLSSDILPEYREFERTATTVINGYVAPLMDRYLQTLRREIAPRPLRVMQSNGGLISPEIAGQQAARTVLSGPAGGVVGARYVAELAGFEQIIAFDMGGTSADVALCPGHLPLMTDGEIAGLPLRLPSIDIHTVGAGGGSLAYVDPGGALHVGPQSAGADPGPACYGRDLQNWRWPVGTFPPDFQLPITVTDANLLLGRLDGDHFLGGTMGLDGERARAALGQLAAAMATPMNAPDVETAAWGVLQLANATMERAVRRVSVERGYDPRDFTLVAFGGAGPLHGCELAARMQIPRVLIPAAPGALSALGMLVASPARDYSQTVMLTLRPDDNETPPLLTAAWSEMAARAFTEAEAEGYAAASVNLTLRLDMRYAGQSHELTVARPQTEAGPEELRDAFHAAHRLRYGYDQPQAPVEIVNLRVTAVTPTPPPDLPHHLPGSPDATSALLGHKPVWFEQRPWPTRLYDRRKLQPGHRFNGPAIVFQYDTTTVIPPGWEAAVDGYGNLVLQVAQFL
jgi:N-methylhydantoinase A